jgi:hypothetical protein
LINITSSGLKLYTDKMEELLEYWENLLAQREADLEAEMSIENSDNTLQKLIIDSIEICKEKIKELSNG